MAEQSCPIRLRKGLLGVAHARRGTKRSWVQIPSPRPNILHATHGTTHGMQDILLNEL